MRHILQTLQPLTSAYWVMGIYKWTYEHVSYKVSCDSGASAYKMRHTIAEPGYLRATDFGFADHLDIDYFADTHMIIAGFSAQGCG
jgi:hypothetical protein